MRLAARALHGLEIPAGATFSFWRQLGRTTRRRGFTAGRELREGCLVPSIGGGLCQLTGPLYQTALAAGFQIIERHAHSRVIPGSAAAIGLDATVFWNYVDLRFASDFMWRLEVELDATHLIVRMRSAMPGEAPQPHPIPPDPPRPISQGDCLTCGQTSCFRHPSATSAHRPALGHTTYLLDAYWPEFQDGCSQHSQPGDRWLTPLDGHRWNKTNYQWSPPTGTSIAHATLTTLLRAWRQRRLPAQGASRQSFLLKADAELAADFAKRIDPQCRHLVIAQNLLPHLWRLGILGGRTFDVLLHRWPLEELHRRLDQAALHHQKSSTLSDFRADPQLVRDESSALARAGRLITPHNALADWAGDRAWRLTWALPTLTPTPPEIASDTKSSLPRLFFPASPLARKGIHELAAALRSFPAELIVLGHARENPDLDPLKGLSWRQGTLADLSSSRALVLPAWVEHEPRIALRALAMGIPVVATRACGLPPHPLLTEIDEPDSLTGWLQNLLEVPVS
nr:VanW family protein [Haloferula luteola]